MITQKPDDRLIKDFRIVAVLIGVCFTLVGFLMTYVLYKIPSYKRANMPFEVWASYIILVFGFVAYIQFLGSGFRRSKMLRLFLLYSCFFNLAGVFFYTFILFFPVYNNLSGNGEVIGNGILALLLGTADFVAAGLLQKARVPKLKKQDGERALPDLRLVTRTHLS